MAQVVNRPMGFELHLPFLSGRREGRAGEPGEECLIGWRQVLRNLDNEPSLLVNGPIYHYLFVVIFFGDTSVGRKNNHELMFEPSPGRMLELAIDNFNQSVEQW